MKIELENCQKSLTFKDFEEVESKLGHVLPERLKEFYLQYNGGEPKQQTISINKYYFVKDNLHCKSISYIFMVQI